MAAVIANEFTEAADPLYLNALIEIGLVLFIITLIVNGLSRLLIWSMARSQRGSRVAAAAVPAEAETAA
jgi:phosphate transport system permease protein